MSAELAPEILKNADVAQLIISMGVGVLSWLIISEYHKRSTTKKGVKSENQDEYAGKNEVQKRFLNAKAKHQNAFKD